MTLYIGVDLYPHQQTAAWCDTRTGETDTFDLKHDLAAVREFYAGFEEFGGRSCDIANFRVNI